VTSQGNKASDASQQLLVAAFPAEWREAPLGWDAVLAWEVDHGVVLPEPYRTFVAEIADGSSYGPPEDGGLLPLNWLPADWPGEDRDEAADFPLTEAWFWENDPRDPDDVEALVDEVYRCGSVVLGSMTGPVYWLLVVSGPQRGQIWLLSDVGALPFPGPDGAEQDGTGFMGWVQRWHEDPEAWDLALR
jgi:hypothetical protein